MKNNLREIRIRRGKTQKELGEHLGITEAAYSRYENSRRKLTDETLMELSRYLECTVDDILAPDLASVPEERPDDGSAALRSLFDAAIGRIGPTDRALLAKLVRSFMALSGEGRERAVDDVDTMVRSGKFIRLGVVEFSDGDPRARRETA